MTLLRSCNLVLILALMATATACGADSNRLAAIRSRVEPGLKLQLQKADLSYGAPVFLRTLKEENQLELWIEPAPGSPYRKFRSYTIANWGSGSIGPKLREGDGQAPEGFYQVTTSALNPNSSYHLSFNLGFPNAYDRHHGRTGSYLMVHGKKVSIGCYAMTDPSIEEIYLIVEAALAQAQNHVPVHCYPFRMTDERLGAAAEAGSRWSQFWRNLKTGYDRFEKELIPPAASLDPKSGKYRFTSGRKPGNS